MKRYSRIRKWFIYLLCLMDALSALTMLNAHLCSEYVKYCTFIWQIFNTVQWRWNFKATRIKLHFNKNNYVCIGAPLETQTDVESVWYCRNGKLKKYEVIATNWYTIKELHVVVAVCVRWVVEGLTSLLSVPWHMDSQLLWGSCLSKYSAQYFLHVCMYTVYMFYT